MTSSEDSPAAKLEWLEQRLAAAHDDLYVAQKREALTAQHAENLARVVDQLRGEIAEADKRQFRREKLIGSGRVQLAAFDQQLFRLRLQNSNLTRLREFLQKHLAELRDRNVALATETRIKSDKVQAMQQSFSWRITSGIRLLRRALGGQSVKVQSKVADDEANKFTRAPVMSSGVDSPQNWKIPAGVSALRGWCLADDGRLFCAVRARLARQSFEGIYGFKRVDVSLHFPGVPAAEFCGWEIEADFKSTDRELFLEACDEFGTWTCFVRADLQVG